MPISTDIFRPIISRRDIEQAVLAHLKLWLPTYAAEVERQAGLPTQTIPLPPDPDLSYKGAIDWDTWTIGAEPVLVVQVKSEGAPERFGDSTYSQMFQIHVAAIVQMEDEDTAREYADYYGAIIMGTILQHGGLGQWPWGDTVASKTVLAEYPDVEFVDVESLGRRVCRTVVTFLSAIDAVVTEAAGPKTPPENPYAPSGAQPTITSAKTTFQFVPLTQEV